MMRAALREEYFDLIAERTALQYDPNANRRWFGAMADIFHNKSHETLFNPEHQFWWDITAAQFEAAIAFLKNGEHTDVKESTNTAALMAQVLSAWNSKRSAWEKRFGTAIDGIVLSQIGQHKASLHWSENLPKATPEELQNILDFFNNLTE